MMTTNDHYEILRGKAGYAFVMRRQSPGKWEQVTGEIRFADAKLIAAALNHDCSARRVEIELMEAAVQRPPPAMVIKS